MKVVFKVILLFGVFLLSFGKMYSQNELEIRPKYMPMMEKHRNVKDENGRKQGLWKFYSRDGILILEVTYQNDVKHGPCVRYHPSLGYPIEELNYFNGRKDGVCKKYYISGELRSEGYYKDGKRVDKWVYYQKVNGEKKAEGGYFNGQKEGEWLYYNSKGVIVLKGSYKNGLKQGVWEFNDAEGKLLYTKNYLNDQEVGDSKPTTPKSNGQKKGKVK